MQFIEYRPRVLLIDLDKNVRIIREKEDLDYVVEKETE
jgi:hypothetical protein